MAKPKKEGSPKRVRRSPEVLMKELDEKMKKLGQDIQKEQRSGTSYRNSDTQKG